MTEQIRQPVGADPHPLSEDQEGRVPLLERLGGVEGHDSSGLLWVAIDVPFVRWPRCSSPPFGRKRARKVIASEWTAWWSPPQRSKPAEGHKPLVAVPLPAHEGKA